MPDITNSESQTRLSVIMFSDIVGYSKMMQESESLAMTLLNRHNDIIREALSKHEGKEIKVIGDAFLVSFATVANAVRCAVDIQGQFGKYNESASDKEKILLRIGIHMGDIIVKDNDVFGDGVNIASRIEPLAEPGGICISQEVYNLVRHKLDLQVVSLGPKELKNIKDKIEIYEILVGSLTADAHKAKVRKKRITTWAYAIAAVLVIAIGLWIALRTLNKASSTMVTRMLKTGSTFVNTANISPDGNWIVYCTPDSRRCANLFVIHSSGGEPRKITKDTSFSWKRFPSFSPDANQIVYEDEDDNDYDIYIVPTQGRMSRKIASRGNLPVWSPDGKHIAFFRSDGTKLVMIDPDGTGEKEITRFSPVLAYNVAWSPDSKRLAFLRSFDSPRDGKYTEIFSRALDDSAERQITFDKKIIGDFCWASTGEIIFNSTRGGGSSLWVIPEDGGTPKQLTVGSGYDKFPRISRDAHRLIYINEVYSLNAWTIDLQTKQLQQLTFEDALIGSLSYSWDGNKLFYYRRNTSDSQDGFVLCNSDGSEQTRLLPKMDPYSPEPNAGAHWSPDMRSIFFTGMRNDTLRRNPDSILVKYRIFELVLVTNETRTVRDGALLDVSRDGKYLICAPDLNLPVRAVLASRSAPDKAIKENISSRWNRWSQFSWDSKSVITPELDSSMFNAVRLWITTLDESKKEYPVKIPKNFHLVEPMPDGTSLLGTVYHEDIQVADLVRIHIANGKIEEIAKLPQRSLVIVGGYYRGSVTPDGKTLAFGVVEWKNRIMVLDNFR